MKTAPDPTNRLLDALASAKRRSDELNAQWRKGLDVADDVSSLEGEVKNLEEEAKATMKALGRVNPETRAVYRAMADMLIAWHTFHDSLKAPKTDGSATD